MLTNTPHTARKTIFLLGARFEFESNSLELMRLVASAYEKLPRHRMADRAPTIRITLLLAPPGKDRPRGVHPSRRRPAEPPPLAMVRGYRLLGAATQSSNFVILSVTERSALALISAQMLQHFGYHTRYEMIEFAVFMLAARVLKLVPLHAACVGRQGRGILLLGSSGAGKSTTALQCSLAGFDFLSEDSVFVDPKTMLATGAANFLHLRPDSVDWLGRSSAAALIRRSPVIQRRSGVRKFEVNLRQDPFRLARTPLKIAAVVCLSSKKSGAQPLLRPLTASELRVAISGQQAYGAGAAQWRLFERKLGRLAAFELRRGRHPREAADALKRLV